MAVAFMLLVLGLELGFLLLIINTGMLVYQKIRLQTATDLAAYAGASVQASYLGNGSSAEESIRAINGKILERYSKLLEDLKGPYPSVWPGLILVPAAGCAALCVAANLANGAYAVQIYKDASDDIQNYHKQVKRILEQLPEASRRAAEETIKLNIPDLSLDEGNFGSNTTNNVQNVIQAYENSSPFSQKKNAILSFSSEKGMYLANVVAGVPHAFPYYGPMCFCYNCDASPSDMLAYCAVNGTGYPGGQKGYNSALLAYMRSFSPIANGNVGNISAISDPNSNAIRLNFIENPHRPAPFFMVSGEWYPENGTFANLENSLGATGSFFPKQTRLVAVSAAEPFGGSLTPVRKQTYAYGVRLQSIRKILLSPTMVPVRGDFPGLFDYMHSLSPLDDNGEPMEKAEEVIKRFLH